MKQDSHMDLAPASAAAPSDRSQPKASADRSRSHAHSHHSQYRQHSKRSRRIRSLQLINLLLTLTLVVVFIGWINTWVNYNASEDDRVALAADLRKKSEELEKIQILNSKLHADLSALVQQRLPGLRDLRFDTTLPIDEAYVRNISFTQTGVGEERRYEYSLVLENRSREILKPSLRILLFDESGLQTGAADLTAKAATTNSDLEFLDPNEIRAYTASIPFERDNTPEYFQIIIAPHE